MLPRKPQKQSHGTSMTQKKTRFLHHLKCSHLKTILSNKGIIRWKLAYKGGRALWTHGPGDRKEGAASAMGTQAA